MSDEPRIPEQPKDPSAEDALSAAQRNGAPTEGVSPDEVFDIPAAPETRERPAAASGPAYEERLERLGGEPAPVITPEEFARLQRAGQVHIDERGRIRTTRRSDAEAGVSLRKRRAWY